MFIYNNFVTEQGTNTDKGSGVGTPPQGTDVPSLWAEERGQTDRFECPGSPAALDGSHRLLGTLSLGVVWTCTRASVCAHMCAWACARGEAQLVEGGEALGKSGWQGWGCQLCLVQSWGVGEPLLRGAHCSCKLST